MFITVYHCSQGDEELLQDVQDDDMEAFVAGEDLDAEPIKRDEVRFKFIFFDTNYSLNLLLNT